MSNHRAILAIALPMVLANLSVPMLGFVDTAILGHLESATNLAAVHLGATTLSLAFWSFGFLRMSTTGITSRQLGASNITEVRHALLRSVLMAGVIALPVIAAGLLLFPLVIPLLAHGSAVAEPAQQYVQIRLWSAPATLGTYAIIGWLIGLGSGRSAMGVMVATNLLNAALDYLFIVEWQWGYRGAALASLCAEYGGLIPGLLICRYQLKKMAAPKTGHFWKQSAFAALLRANRDIFVRTLCLLLVFLSMSSLAVAIDAETAAATAILLNLLAFSAYFMDGFAFAAESLGGRAWGRRNRNELLQVIWKSSYLALGVAACFSLVFAALQQPLLQLYTDLPQVLARAGEIFAWLTWLPLLAIWCYQLDGIFIGIGRTATLRNAMLLSAAGYALLVWAAADNLSPASLWTAFWVFHAMRTASLALPLALILRKDTFAGQSQPAD